MPDAQTGGIMSNIAVVGTGYVGLTTGACFAHLGHRVVCVDIDVDKVRRLEAGDIPIYEPGMRELVLENVEARRLRFTSTYTEGLDDVEFVFIAVGTPTADDGHSADLSYVHAATRETAAALKDRAIVINKSTSPIGTADGIRQILEEYRPELSPWQVVSNPEFLREGLAIHDCLHPFRIVLGANDRDSASAVATLYSAFDCPVIITDLHTAEMIKYASNAFLATKISFINEVARICDALGADVCTVAHGMGLDERIGGEFLNAGLGYGGSCFPKDVAALAQMAAGVGLHPQLLHAVSDINIDQRRWVVDRLSESLGTLAGKTVAVWGLAFKPETDDLREAPAVDVARRLISAGATVRLYDPVVTDAGVAATHAASAYEAAEGADAVLVATEWDEFKGISWDSVADSMRGTVIFDARNAMNEEAISAAGLTYLGVGRKPAPVTLREAVTA
jgi:UDPglucose 6-dehydrogenase